jgi:hypothetical protein
MRIRLILCRYGRDKCFDELLDFAAEMLVAGGRLVYWLPVIQAGDTFGYESVLMKVNFMWLQDTFRW